MTRRGTPRWLEAARAAGASRPVGERPDWLARALPRAGILPPPEAEAAVRAGRVAISGRTVREPLGQLRPGDEVTLDGKRVELAAPTLVLAFHKPAGAVTAPSDPHGRPTVFGLLAKALPPALSRYGWHAVGRLDVGTTGLLLFTNDERFVEHATAPATHLPKRYLATVQGTVDDAKLTPLRRGVSLDDGPARPAVAEVRGPSQVALTITEGRNHQVKRMLAAVGLPVRELHREAVGGLDLDVPPGAVRLVTPEELARCLGFPAPAPPGGLP